MDLLHRIKKALERKQPIEVPLHYCPNCWGREEYSGNLFKAVHKEKIDLTNINEKKGWIQEYAAKNLVNIKLQKQEDDYICLKCNMNEPLIKIQ